MVRKEFKSVEFLKKNKKPGVFHSQTRFLHPSKIGFKKEILTEYSEINIQFLIPEKVGHIYYKVLHNH